MDVLITLFYLLFTVCVVYPPTECVSAGFTIAQIFDSYLGSENVNFVEYHMKRIALTLFIHSFLPLGYVFCLWCGDGGGSLFVVAAIVTATVPLLAVAKINSWWHMNKKQHPIARVLSCYAPVGGDWRTVASDLNTEYRSVDKVVISLSATSKFVASESWLVKVCQYSVNLVRQGEVALVATATDTHNLTTSGEDEVQYINIDVIPARNVPRFSFRVSTVTLRELQTRLAQQVMVPDHLTLQPSLVVRFIVTFKRHAEENPIYHVNEILEPCLGCMQTQADVKLRRRCDPVAAALANPDSPPCEECFCRVLWCVSCIARWWAAQCRQPPAAWLEARGSCPLCRARFCLLDVCLARPVGEI